MSTTQALTVALIALTAQIAQSKRYQSQEHTNKATQAYLGEQIAEAEAACAVLLEMLEQLSNQQRGEA